MTTRIVSPDISPDRDLLHRAADVMQMALYVEDAERLRRLAEAPIFESPYAISIIQEYTLTIRDYRSNGANLATIMRLQEEALRVLRGEPLDTKPN